MNRRSFIGGTLAAIAGCFLPKRKFIKSITICNKVNPNKCLGQLGASALNMSDGVQVNVVNATPDDVAAAISQGKFDDEILRVLRRRDSTWSWKVLE